MELVTTTFQQAWFGGLLALWAALLFGGFALGRPHPETGRRMPTWTRMASSLVLVVAAWSWWSLCADSGSNVLLLIAIGMSLGFVGDLCMAHLLPLPNDVLGGMASFGLGHVAYIGALLLAGRELDASGPRWLAWIVWLIIAAIGWYIVVWRGAIKRTLLHRAALPYALLLASTAGVATGLAFAQTSFGWVALGAALFLFSDLVLAAQLFNTVRWRLVHDAVWLLYGPGQMLIVFGMGAMCERRG